MTTFMTDGIVGSGTIRFSLPKGVAMPFIEVDEVPEGTEEADVIARSEYDALVTERDGANTQRDEALERITQLENEVRDVKAKYAERVLSTGHGPDSHVDETKPEPSKLAVSTDGLWK